MGSSQWSLQLWSGIVPHDAHHERAQPGPLAEKQAQDEHDHAGFFQRATGSFFLLAGAVCGLLHVGLGRVSGHSCGRWLMSDLPFAMAPHYWHAHEMIFGYGGAAVIAGFLMTAAPIGLGGARGRVMVSSCWLQGSGFWGESRSGLRGCCRRWLSRWSILRLCWCLQSEY